MAAPPTSSAAMLVVDPVKMALRCASFRTLMACVHHTRAQQQRFLTTQQRMLYLANQPLRNVALLKCMCRFRQRVMTSCRQYSSSGTDEISLSTPLVKRYVEAMVQRYQAAEQRLMESVAGEERAEAGQTLNEARNITKLYQEYQAQSGEKYELTAIIAGGEDAEMVQMAKLELESMKNDLDEKEAQVLALLVQPQPADDHDVVLEVQAGVGGQEAMLFAEELFDMYRLFAERFGWTFNVMQQDTSDLGGMRQGIANVSGAEVYRWLKFEGGVHRVQRVPRTEKTGRMHTSTITVSVMPQPTDIDIIVEKKDLRIDVFRASGAGGQHVNKTESAVRLTHIPSGRLSNTPVTLLGPYAWSGVGGVCC